MNTLFRKCLEAGAQAVSIYRQRYWAASDATCKGTPPPAPPPPPPPPPPPSYAEVTTEAIRLLPTQKKIELAARFGDTVEYEDPVSGELRTADFSGYGETDLARRFADYEMQTARERAPEMLEMYKQYGPEYARAAREQLEASDPYGFATREQLGQAVSEGAGSIPALPSAPTLSDITAGPEYERLEEADIPVLPVDDSTLEGRRYMEQVMRGRAEGGRFAEQMGERARRIARGRAAATGNIFGGGAVLDEARAVEEAETGAERQAISDYLGFLQSGQTAEDYQSRIAQQNLANRMMGMQQRSGVKQLERADELSVLNQQNQLAQQAYANAVGQIQGQEALRQQRLANLQAFAFGQPLVSQLGSLSSMQQQAVPYMPAGLGNQMGFASQLAATGAHGLDVARLQQQQFGTQANIFGTQGNIWGQQAQMAGQPGLGGMLAGKMLGGITGAMSGGIGTALGGGFGGLIGGEKWGTGVTTAMGK